MRRMFFLNAFFVIAFSVASGCADTGWLRKKPPLPEALVGGATDEAVPSKYAKASINDRQSPAGDKSTNWEATKSNATPAALGSTKPGAPQIASARESFAAASERVLSNPAATPQDYADLRRSLAQPDAEVPPAIKQQFLAAIDFFERQSTTASARDPVLLQPAHAEANSPTRPQREPATIAAPHVTVNVHAGGATADPQPETIATAARHELKPDVGDTKSPLPDAAAPPTEDKPRRPLAAEPPSLAKTADVESTPTIRPGEWREQVQLTIDALEAELRRDSADLNADEQARLATYLRLLNVVADRHDAAVAPIDSPDKSQQQFWQHQLHALVVALDESGTPVLTRRAALALRELREAASHLAALSALDLRNLAFCMQVDGFGTFASFAKNEFKPDQEVLLYVEVDNFTTEEKSAGRRGELFETELRGSYQIFDPTGRRVADVELPLDKQSCRSRRRDYFIAYPIYLPKKIESGSYTLQLTIEDAKASKFGQGSIELKIKN